MTCSLLFSFSGDGAAPSSFKSCIEQGTHIINYWKEVEEAPAGAKEGNLQEGTAAAAIHVGEEAGVGVELEDDRGPGRKERVPRRRRRGQEG